MPRLNVGKVLSNPQFSENFIVNRKTGDFIAGRFVQTETVIPFTGVVIAGGTEDIIQVPEGDRNSEIMVFLSVKKLFVTHNDANGKGTSDEIVWKDNRYRLYQGKNWGSYGYYRAIGVSMGGV